ncbi:MAG TPA: nicotinate-nucleotide adenylyltransferase [Methylophilaceae bacterium]|jgi:nicotinate-nucleotide adenylyltransferase
MKRTMIGILGGTFDPIHNGHLRMARDTFDQRLLSKVLFIPTGHPPHREEPQTPVADRLEMVRLAVEYKPGFELDDREIKRGGVSYTVDTLTELRAELGKETGLCLLLGVDAFLGLPTWHQWQRLFDLAHILVARRAGKMLKTADMSAELVEQWQQRKVKKLPATPAGSILEFAMTPVDVSATEIRELLHQRRSVEGMLPYSVLNYILQNHLYE